jgi:hypothetical protein
MIKRTVLAALTVLSLFLASATSAFAAVPIVIIIATQHPSYWPIENGSTIDLSSSAVTAKVTLEEPGTCAWDLLSIDGTVIAPDSMTSEHWGGTWWYHPHEFSATFGLQPSGASHVAFACKTPSGDTQKTFNVTFVRHAK